MVRQSWNCERVAALDGEPFSWVAHYRQATKPGERRGLKEKTLDFTGWGVNRYVTRRLTWARTKGLGGRTFSSEAPSPTHPND